MKIGVSSYSFSSFPKKTTDDYLKICDKAKELGFRGIEFTTLSCPFPVSAARKIAAHCKKIGIDIIAYSVDADFNSFWSFLTVTKLKKQVDIATALGAPIMRHDICHNKLGKSQTYKDVIAKAVPKIKAVSEYARTKGIKTCSENHGTIFQNSNRMLELYKAVNCDNYALLCDIGNFLCAEEEPQHAVPLVAPYAIHVHAKDFLRRSNAEGAATGYFKTAGGNYLAGTTLGKGTVPVEFCLKTLKNAGYNGYISLEYEGNEDCVQALATGLKFAKKTLEETK